MNGRILVLFFALIIMALPFGSSARFVIGQVNDALDGEEADGYVITLWKPSVGVQDNETDIIGESGASGTPGFYQIDCELLDSPCAEGDEIRVKVFNNGSNYVTAEASLTVNTSLSFDEMENLTLNSPPFFVNLSVDDDLSTPSGEIDLTPASTREVFCEGVAYDHDGADFSGVRAEFFDSVGSFLGDSDANRIHYTNESCFVNSSYGGANESYVSCGFDVTYYASNSNWSCAINFSDGLVNLTASNDTYINPLVSIGVDGPVTFDVGASGEVSSELTVDVTNYGNVMLNLSLSGYGEVEGDDLAMACVGAGAPNITIDYQKYNLTDSTPGNLTLGQFENFYINLSSTPTVNIFNLNSRQSDLVNDAVRPTYWRIFVPADIEGTCTGNILFGAVRN